MERRSRLLLIGLTIAAELVVAQVLMQRHPGFARQVNSWLSLISGSQERPAIARHDLSRDPPIGGPAPAWQLRRLDGRAASLSDYSGKHTRLVFVGACNSCVLDRLEPLLKHDPASAQVRLVATADKEARARWLSSELGPRVTVLLDRDRITSRIYNAAFVPRAYTIDPEGILRHAQHPSQTLARALQR